MLLLLLLLLPARGQDGDTSLAGIVEDLSGARIAHANITLTNSDNGFHAGAVTDGGGALFSAYSHPAVTRSRPRRPAWQIAHSLVWSYTSAGRCNCS